MAELKTKQNNLSVEDFLNKIENTQKKEDCFEIMRVMQEATKQPPKMWGGAIVGFGNYHYKYESGHEGDMCKVGFSPRKASTVLYISCDDNKELLPKLGKHKVSGSCLHLNKLADVDKAVLKKMVKTAYDHKTTVYG